MIPTQYDIVLELTLRCNLACPICVRHQLKDKQSELPLSKLQAILDELRDHKIKVNFALGGYGEPLLYPQIIEAIDMIKTRFPTSSLVLTTNGHRLTQSMADNLLQSRLDYLRVSLNGITPNEYERLMGQAGLELVLGNLRYLLTAKERPFKIGIQILQTPDNAEQLPAFRSEWEPMLEERDFIALRQIENHAGKVAPCSLAGELATSAANYPCYALWRHLAITATGDVYACCEAFSFREEKTLLKLGHVEEESLHSMLQGQQLASIRNMHLADQYQALPECRRCSKPINYPNICTRRDGRWYLND